LLRRVLAVVGEMRACCEALARALEEETAAEVISVVPSAERALERLAETAPDVVVLAVHMPDVPLVARAVAAAVPQAKLVALGIGETEAEVVACAEAGVSGFVARDAPFRELARTVDSAARDEATCSPHMTAVLLRRLASIAGAAPDESELTAREREIAKMIELGLSNKEIASRLSIALPTVKTHVHNILDKLHATRRTQIAASVRTRLAD
jgi:two-component system, NarL family, nitrate/nitrite response regulator NarL